ncbi:hypothetical protein [Bacteroides sp. 224]|uniref:hypothetical protein n=1 Tax=Bacteroides sp. 224 TaxID=2302936 RepID=UPI0013D2BA6D|nr:hypothetical protein [Bacteroides sp. 224]NDV66580.1 hypothetical protein [Bacteroides sp. 224]
MHSTTEKMECIVIMPIEKNYDGYETDHFKNVYNTLIKPSVAQAGYHPLRADEINSGIIDHYEIINKIVNAPMAVFDLSTWNDRIITGLKIRKSFNKPTIVLSDIYTPKFFNSDNIKYLEYKKDMNSPVMFYTQLTIAESIKELSEQDGREGIKSPN